MGITPATTFWVGIKVDPSDDTREDFFREVLGIKEGRDAIKIDDLEIELVYDADYLTGVGVPVLHLTPRSMEREICLHEVTSFSDFLVKSVGYLFDAYGITEKVAVYATTGFE